MLPIKATSYAPNTALFIIESVAHGTGGTALAAALQALVLDPRAANCYIHSYTIVHKGNNFDCVLLCIDTTNQQKAVIFASVTP